MELYGFTFTELVVILTSSQAFLNEIFQSLSIDPKKVQHTNKVRGRTRNGGHTPESAYYGTSPQHYYITPPEFFSKYN